MVCNNIIVTYKNNKYNIIINKILTDINTICFSINFFKLNIWQGCKKTKAKKQAWLTKSHYSIDIC